MSEKSPIYGRGLLLTLTAIIPKMPDQFTITSLMNAVQKQENTSMRGTNADNLRDRIKNQMEYFITVQMVTSEVIDQDGIKPPYITQYTKTK